MKHSIAIILATALIGCAAHREPGELDAATRAAYEHLLGASVWIDGNVYGFAGEEENESATALRTIWKHPQSAAIFSRLLDHAAPAGQLYALCGLYYSDRAEFEKRIAPFKTDQREIPTISADVHGPQKIADIVVCPYEGTNYLDIISGKWSWIFRDRPYDW